MPNRLKPKIIVYHRCQFALNQKLSRNFEKWHKLLSCIEVKSHKKNLNKKRPTYRHMQQEQQKVWMLLTVSSSNNACLFDFPTFLEGGNLDCLSLVPPRVMTKQA